MSCCGQKRADLKSGSTQATMLATTPLVTNTPLDGGEAGARTIASAPSGYYAVTLHYLEDSPILVTGTVTGRQYAFSGAQPDQSVDTRDAKPLLRTPFFRRS